MVRSSQFRVKRCRIRQRTKRRDLIKSMQYVAYDNMLIEYRYQLYLVMADTFTNHI